MKKFLSILLTLSLILGTASFAFAEEKDTTHTPDQKQAREAYQKLHFDDMNQLVSLRQQTKDARDANSVDAKQIKEKLKTKISINKDSAKDANKTLKDNVKNQLEKAKTIHETIKTQQEEKSKLWSTYKENMKNKDYTTAGLTFKSIIDKKSSILNNLKQRSAILKQVLVSLN